MCANIARGVSARCHGIAPFLGGGGGGLADVGVPWRAEVFTGPDRAHHLRVTADYFQTAGVRLVQGRSFSPADFQADQPVAILSDWASALYFGDRDPVGQVITVSRAARTVVGVVSGAH